MADNIRVMEKDNPQEDVPIELHLDGVLDLHAFSPKDVGDLIPEYLHECIKRGIRDIRIIHGKGSGTLRKTVHSILGRMPEVETFRLADETAGSWGATLVRLCVKISCEQKVDKAG